VLSDRIHGASLIAGAIIGIVILIMISLGQRKKSLSLIPISISGKADVEMTDSRFFSTKDGRVEWEIQAKSTEIFEQKHRALLDDIQVKFHKTDGMGMTLQGEKGILDTVSKDFQITNQKDPIKVSMNHDYHLYTSSLEWINNTRQIRSTDPIQLDGPGLHVKGTGLRVSLDLHEIQVLHDVVAHFNH
jgi:lipopolysaccharide export system protein LptC